MLVEVNQKELKKALATVGKAKGLKSDKAYTRWVKLAAKGVDFTLSVIGVAATITAKVSGEIAELGEIAVDFVALKKIIGKGTSETVILSTEESGLTIKADGSTTLPSCNLEDYPVEEAKSSETETPLIIIVKAKALKKAVDSVAKAALRETNDSRQRQALLGINVEFGDKLTLVATDGYHMAIETLELEPGSGGSSGSVLIPAWEWSKALGGLGTKDDICLSSHAGKVSMDTNNVTITLDTIPEDFPDYHRVIPSNDSPYRIEVKAKALLNAVQRAEIMTHEENDAVTLSTSGGESALKITSENRDKGVFEERIRTFNGFVGILSYSLRADYVEAFCKRHKGETIEIILSKYDQASIWQAVDNPDSKTVIMPVRLDYRGASEPPEWSVEDPMQQIFAKKQGSNSNQLRGATKPPR